MPVLVLFLCLFGNYYTYHSKGDLVKVEQGIYSDGYFISDPVSNSGFVDSVYFNTSLTVEETVSLLNSLPIFQIDDGLGYILLASIDGPLIAAIPDNDSWVILDFTNEIFFFTSIDIGFGFVGWNPDVSYPYSVNSDVTDFVLGVDVGIANNLISSLFGLTPFQFVDGELISTAFNYLVFEEYIGDEKLNLSFFDITLLQTDKTFIKFQLPFLRNAFESVFNIFEFESSYVSSFVLTSFTWMIQLLLLHVVVDTLAFIFKMYHKLMDKVV